LIRLLALALIISPAFTFAAATTQPAVGDDVSDFSAETPAGEAVLLSNLNSNGPVVMIVLRGFPGYQCPICTKQVAGFMSKAEEFKKAGANILLVYPGPAHKLKEHANEFVKGKTLPDNFTLVLDPDYNLVNHFGLRWDKKGETAYPSTVIVDKSSKITFVKISKSHGDRTSAGEVLKSLGEK